MKTIKTMVVALSVALTLAGCSEKNEDYFLKNIDMANKKIDECNKSLEKAFMSNDEASAKKVMENKECQAADIAIKKNKRLQYELEQQRKKAEKENAIKSETATIEKQINGLSWNEVINEYLKVEDCSRSYSFSLTPKCEAWKTIYNKQAEEGKKSLKQLSFDDIKVKMQSFCKLDKRIGSNCAIAQKALEEKASDELVGANIQTIESKKLVYCADDIRNLSACNTSWYKALQAKSDEHVKFYTENDAEFIATYNSCVDKLKEIDSKKLQWNEKNKLVREVQGSYPCSQVKQAYSKRGMGYSDFSKKIEK